MEAAKIAVDSAECEIRSALSRSYYALFHSVRAWLLSQRVGEAQIRTHKGVLVQVGRVRGKEEANRIRDAYRLREDADYRPGLLDAYGGDVARFRAVAETKVELARSDFDWYVIETEKSCTA